MVNWNNFSLGSQVPFGAVSPSMTTRTEVPAAQPKQPAQPSVDLQMLANPFLLLSQLGKGGSPFQLNGSGVSLGGPFGNLLGGLLSPMFSNSQQAAAPQQKTVIDQRSPETQALVSMFQNGGAR